MAITIIPSLAFGQNVNLNEPDAELAASNIEEVLVPIQPILDIESLIRVEQEIIYSKLFGENVLIDEITDYITDIPEVEGDDPVSFDTLGITHDNRIYRVDCPLLFRVGFSEDPGHDEDVINFYSQNNINAYIAYGYLSDFASNSTVYFFGMILYSPTLNNGAPLLIPLKELPDATETEMQTILSATGTASEFQLAFPACTDLHGNPLTPDLEYDLCRESAYDKY